MQEKTQWKPTGNLINVTSDHEKENLETKSKY